MPEDTDTAALPSPADASAHADTAEFRQGYKDNIRAAEDYEAQARELLFKIGWGLGIAFAVIAVLELLFGGWDPVDILLWIPVAAAVSAPFFLQVWLLRRRRYECLTLAFGFQRKAIVEERVFAYAGEGGAARRRELLAFYVAHWMDKSPLEVMLSIGGKGKGMGGASTSQAFAEKLAALEDKDAP